MPARPSAVIDTRVIYCGDNLDQLRKLPPGCSVVMGDALDSRGWSAQVAPADTLVHLVGVSHPSPAKAAQFRSIDLVSARAAMQAATASGVRHFVYVSVAHPAPVMKAYIEARAEGEAELRASGLDATILRPWYVLGPGHRWPYLLVPLYAIARLIPSKRESAERLGLVTLRQMVDALVRAVENPPPAGQNRIVEVPDIRQT